MRKINALIIDDINESIKTKQAILSNEEIISKIKKIAELIVDCYRQNKKVLIFGNGGSACDAQHMVGELVGRFLFDRKALSAIALTADSAVITCIGNDYGYDNVFSRQIEAHANKGDILIGISTSGNSKNVINAFAVGNQIETVNIGLLGKDGGEIMKKEQLTIVIPSNDTPRIQEAHIMIIHTICNLVEKMLFSNEVLK